MRYAPLIENAAASIEVAVLTVLCNIESEADSKLETEREIPMQCELTAIAVVGIADETLPNIEAA